MTAKCWWSFFFVLKFSIRTRFNSQPISNVKHEKYVCLIRTLVLMGTFIATRMHFFCVCLHLYRAIKGRISSLEMHTTPEDGKLKFTVIAILVQVFGNASL